MGESVLNTAQRVGGLKRFEEFFFNTVQYVEGLQRFVE